MKYRIFRIKVPIWNVHKIKTTELNFIKLGDSRQEVMEFFKRNIPDSACDLIVESFARLFVFNSNASVVRKSLIEYDISASGV